MTLHTFFAMGGYALYVWPAYAVFFIVLVADWCAPILRRRRLLRELRGRLARQKARADRSPGMQTDTRLLAGTRDSGPGTR